MKWLKHYAPYLCENCPHLINEREYKILLSKTSLEHLCFTVLSIENRVDLCEKYNNLYLTTLSWLKRDYEPVPPNSNSPI